MDVADRKKDRAGVVSLTEERARRTLDRIAERHRGDPERLAAFVEEQRQAENPPGPVTLAVRQAILDSGLSLNEIERRTGVHHGVLSRFMRTGRTMRLETVDMLASTLRLTVRHRRRRTPAGEE